MQISVQTAGPYAEALRGAGFRATFGRVALLAALSKSAKPLSAESLSKKVKGKLDVTNTYRALEALAKAGLIHRVDVGHRHMHYEIAALGPHHHHYVCESCGFRPAHA
jgi:Fur family ferric uptake transcriptional regulator